MNFDDFGHTISDNSGELRDISGIIVDLRNIVGLHSTHAMSSWQLFLEGQKDGVLQVIKYLERV